MLRSETTRTPARLIACVNYLLHCAPDRSLRCQKPVKGDSLLFYFNLQTTDFGEDA